MKKTLARIGTTIALTGILCSCAPFKAMYERYRLANPKTHAIIYSNQGDDESNDAELIHPIDKNITIIAESRIYKKLINNGVDKDNIFVLYDDRVPDWDDPAIEKELKIEFNGSYSNIATPDNLKRIEARLDDKLYANDTLIIVMMMRGEPQGYLTNNFGGNIIRSSDISDMLDDNKTDNNLIIVEANDANSFIDKLEIKGDFIGSSYDNAMWADREDAFSVKCMTERYNPDNDLDNDGIVSADEAYDAASKVWLDVKKAKKEFIVGEYLKAAIKGNMHPFTKLGICAMLDGIDFVTYYKKN